MNTLDCFILSTGTEDTFWIVTVNISDRFFPWGDTVTAVQNGENFISRNEEQRLKNLANGFDDAD